MGSAGDRQREIQRKHVVVAVWVIEFLPTCVNKSMGVLLPVLLDQFTTDTRNVGIVVSLSFLCGNLIGKQSYFLFLTFIIIIFCILDIYCYTSWTLDRYKNIKVDHR